MFWLLLLRDFLISSKYGEIIGAEVGTNILVQRAAKYGDSFDTKGIREALDTNPFSKRRTHISKKVTNRLEKKGLINLDLDHTQVLGSIGGRNIISATKSEMRSIFLKDIMGELGVRTIEDLDELLTNLINYPQTMVEKFNLSKILMKHYNQLLNDVNFRNFLQKELRSNPLYRFAEQFGPEGPYFGIDGEYPLEGAKGHDKSSEITVHMDGAMINMTSSWVLAASFIPMYFQDSGIYGVLEIITKKDHNHYVFPHVAARTFKDMVDAKGPVPGHGAGSVLWDSNLLHRTQGGVKRAFRTAENNKRKSIKGHAITYKQGIKKVKTVGTKLGIKPIKPKKPKGGK